MNKLFCILAVVFLLALPGRPVAAADKVKLLAGTQSSGKLTEISPTEVVVELGQTKKKFAVNDLDTVSFDSEPNGLTQARFAVRAGRYEDALAQLEKVDMKKVDRAEISADVDFFKAISAARLALSGNGSISDAGKMLLAFEKTHAKSFHYFEACEMLGDLFTGVNRFDKAETYYGHLASAPWPDHKMRAGVLVGRSLVGQKEFDKALAKFDEVLTMDASGKEAERQKLSALLGKASALAGSGKNDEAIQAVEAIIAKADAENQELHARAYTILGNCHRAAKKNKEALLDFLHVDLLYSRFPEQHAEALANLATLWTEVDKADRATQARNLLKEKYPNSTWAQK